ncbi:PREDICTED: ZP domain-containing protein-like [Acropora digitifera]|uniref:ZP domain-containing protein-like n=1 Tax=Acropora digitifera TaxID=70779 RepID=UPI00077AFFC2|nr:PREDICTED: ZP domain-containing protein-like [Acropora digitifera]
MIVSDADDFGNFTYRMDLYTNEDYSTKVDTFPFLVGVGQQLYLEKSVESGDPKVVLFADECKATPSPDINAKPDYMIIEKACPRDKTVEYDYKMSASQRFSLSAFRFKSGYDDVYIHCTLTVCRSDDMQSKCVKGCQMDGNSTRKRREIADNYRASLYLGPIKITDGKTNNKALDAPLSKDSTDDNTQWFLLAGLLVGSLGIIALVLIAAIILVLKRRGRTKRTTSLLVQEAE